MIKNTVKNIIMYANGKTKGRKVGKHKDKEIVHLVSQDPVEIEELKSSPDYLSDSVLDLAVTNHDAFLEIVEVIVEQIDVEGEKVKVRIKASQWIKDGKKEKFGARIPHKFLGVDVEESEIEKEVER